MVFHVQTLACRFVVIYIIISALLCQNTNGSSRNNSYVDTSTDNLFLFHFLNESFVIQHPAIPSCEEPPSPKNIALAAFSAVAMLLGFGGNLMVILVIQYSQLRKQPGYVLIKSLAAADLGVSLFVTAVKIHFYLQNGNFCSDLAACVSYNITDGLFPAASITHLFFICINKFCAVNLPYKYHALVTYSREHIVVLFIWLYCSLWTGAGMITWDSNPLFSLDVISIGTESHCYNINRVYYVCAAICVFIIPVVVAGCLYVILISIVVEKVRATPVPVGHLDVPVGNLGALDKNGIQKKYAPQSYGSTKGAKTLMTAFAGWVVCWVPHFSVILVGYWSPSTLYSLAENHNWLSTFINTVVSDILPCINSCINPIIYFITSSIFRFSLQDCYLKLMKKPRHRAGSNNMMLSSTQPTETVSSGNVMYRSEVSKVSFL